MDIIFTILKQIIVLFILIFVGVILSKKNILTDKGIKSVTDVVLYVVAPCVIIKSFIREFNLETLKQLLLSFLTAIIAHLIFIILAAIIFKDKDERRQRVLRFGTVFGNCGFMALPIQQTILGETGVFYCASFIAIFNLCSWTYGVVEMSGDKKSISIKKIIYNPGIIGLLIGIIIFVFSIPIPEVVKTPITYFSALNTPIPMLIIGYHLSKSNFKKAIKDVKCIIACFARLLLFPAVAILAIYLVGFRNELLVSSAISACAPVGAYTTIFASKYDKDTELSVNMVSLSTVLSLLTMPIVISVVQSIA